MVPKNVYGEKSCADNIELLNIHSGKMKNMRGKNYKSFFSHLNDFINAAVKVKHV